MGRFSYLDTDEERLPEGMKRVGYDADTQVYTYRDTDGSYWEGAPGVRYGKLFRVRSAATPLESVTINQDIEGDEPEPELKEGDWDPGNNDDDNDGAAVPRRRDSLVRRFLKRWNTVTRKSRSNSTAPPLLDTKTPEIQSAANEKDEPMPSSQLPMGRVDQAFEPTSQIDASTASTTSLDAKTAELLSATSENHQPIPSQLPMGRVDQLIEPTSPSGTAASGDMEMAHK
ncbi:uncharacterized protein DNG_05843 [Cephalotrichum gorgonifer]|uniref:Uncharacterized protein n=1 Tax=Cephalotrichum gorgonifer TaxID=2041049 RepID=A0AAE8MYP9_9PEZI|nr:uncharacterized protein DNG_05843 [Cephalotrichum gorgonifer]